MNRAKKKVKEFTTSVKEQCFKDSGGLIISSKDTQFFIMETSSKELTKEIFVIKDFTNTKMEIYTKGSGKTILNMVMAS